MSNKSEDFKSISEDKFTSQEKIILDRNKRFYSTDRKYIDTILKIIDGKSNISIRVLDYFVTNYSKVNNIFYKIRLNGIEELFYVSIEYEKQLNGYSKDYFDPFCRKKKVIYSYRDKDSKVEPIHFVSSIGQLNFFRWAIFHKIIKYVEIHLKEIESDMKASAKKAKEERNSNTKLTESPKKKLIEYSDEADPVISSSTKVNSINISTSSKKKSQTKSESDRTKRQRMAKSVYAKGIQKTNVAVEIDFD